MERGERHSDRLLALRALRREADGGPDAARVAVSVGKRFGNAVARNRVRRRVRECTRSALSDTQGAWDLIFMPRAAARATTYDQLRESVSRLLRRAGICGGE